MTPKSAMRQIVLCGLCGLLVACITTARPGVYGALDPATGIVIVSRGGPVPARYNTKVVFTDDVQGTGVWITEARVKIRSLFGFPYVQHPVDIGFPTQEACERFRAAHTYTRPDEVCRLAYYRVER